MTARDPVAIAEAAVTALEHDGYAVVDGLADAGTMERLASELRPAFDALAPAELRNRTRRVHSRVVARSPELQRLLIAPAILGVLDRMLGPHCVRYQLSSAQGIEILPGAADQELHRDDDIFRLPHPHVCFEINAMWAVTAFTAENGATRVVPGSHLLPSGVKPDAAQAVQVAMRPGSLLLWQGATWHGAGANRTAMPRIGLYAGYSLGWLRQEEMVYLALPPDAVRPMPEVLQRLIGYELKGSTTLGWLDGRDPRAVLGLDERKEAAG